MQSVRNALFDCVIQGCVTLWELGDRSCCLFGRVLSLSACPPIEAQKGNLNCHMASTLGNTASLLDVTTSLMCTLQGKEIGIDKYAARV